MENVYQKSKEKAESSFADIEAAKNLIKISVIYQCNSNCIYNLDNIYTCNQITINDTFMSQNVRQGY